MHELLTQMDQDLSLDFTIFLLCGLRQIINLSEPQFSHLSNRSEIPHRGL